MDTKEAVDLFEKMSEFLYQEKTREGLELLEPVVNASFIVFTGDNPIIGVMDAIDHEDYVTAADILHFDMALPAGSR